MKKNSLGKRIWQAPVWLLAFFINLLTASIAIIPFIIKDKGYFAMPFDFTAQEIAFHIFMNNSIKEGNIFWNWAIDLGGNFLESFSFYNLGSAFIWITLLFPSEMIPKVMGWMIILKFACAGATSALFFKRHLSTRSGIVIASLLYAFSGFQCSSVVFYHFQDAVALFPLLLIGLELLVEEKKYGRLAAACVLNVLCNYVFFVGEVIFLILYYVVRYLIPHIRVKRSFREWVAPIGLCIAEGAIGLMSAGVLLLPAIRGTLSNDRVSQHLPGQSWMSMSTTDWLLLLKGLLTPAEAMSSYSSVTSVNWMTNAAYLPLFGVIFVLAYTVTKKDWLSTLLKVCLVIAAVPVLNNTFMFFSEENYRRWFYMPVLFMALATVKVLEGKEKYRIWAGTAIWAFLLGFYFLMTQVVKWNSESANLVFHRKDYYLGLIVAIGGAAAALPGVKLLRNGGRRLFCFAVMICSAFVLFHSIYSYRNTVDNTNQQFAELPNGYGKSAVVYLTEAASSLEKDVLPFRYYFDEGIGHSYYNMAMSASLPSINSFISTVHSSVMEFYDAFQIDRSTWTNGDNSGTRELLGARYVVSVMERDDYNYDFLGSIENSNGQKMYLYENKDALPIGFTYDDYMTRDEFEGFHKDYRARVMLNALVVENDKAKEAGAVLEHLETDRYKDIVETPVSDAVKERMKEECLEFQADKSGFQAVIRADKEKYAFFSVPYDKSWQASVNGEEREILNINGLMAVKINEGNNDIRFFYVYKPFWIGAMCSIIGVAALFIYTLGSNRLLHKEKINGAKRILE